MFIHIENFYEKANNLYEIICKLDFKENLYGDEIKNFNMIPQGIETGFSNILNQKVVVSKDSGIFRKSYPPIHFENFNTNSIYVGIIALEDTKFTIYKHKNTKSTAVISITENLNEFIKENCFDKEKWDIVADINLYQSNLLLFKPWLWHGLDSKLIKVFYLEREVNE
jgi:hypothetical protein